MNQHNQSVNYMLIARQTLLSALLSEIHFGTIAYYYLDLGVDATHVSVKAANFFEDTAALLTVVCAFTLWL